MIMVLDRLRDEFGVTSNALSWLTTYIEDREQYMREGWSAVVVNRSDHIRSSTRVCARTNPACSVHVSIGDIIKRHGVRYHQYADDTYLNIA